MPLATTSRMLAPFLDRLTDEELDSVPYGIVQLDAMGTIRRCNRTELRNGAIDETPVGRNYFLDLYPSANAAEFYGRFLHAVESEQLDETFVFTFACGATPRRVLVRMYYSVRTGGTWIFTARPDGSPLMGGTAPDERATDTLGAHVA